MKASKSLSHVLLGFVGAIAASAQSPATAPVMLTTQPTTEPSVATGQSTTNTLGMKLIFIPGGEFMMGSPVGEAGRFRWEDPPHVEKLAGPFMLAATDVTVAQFTLFVNETGYVTEMEKRGKTTAPVDGAWQQDVVGVSWRNPNFPQGPDHPVVDVGPADARGFCEWLGKKEHRHYRLPTEAEWEFAARAGKRSAYPWGDRPEDAAGWANMADRAYSRVFHDAFEEARIDDGYVYTSPVASFRPNAYGLYDMIGNVQQLCARVRPSGAVQPPGLNERSTISRGGSWHNGPSFCRIGFRKELSGGGAAPYAGFRVCLDVESSTGTTSPSLGKCRNQCFREQPQVATKRPVAETERN